MAIILHFAGVNSDAMLEWIVVPSDLTTLLHRPWTLLTYMFAHYDMLHVLFNMLWLYWLGKLFWSISTPSSWWRCMCWVA